MSNKNQPVSKKFECKVVANPIDSEAIEYESSMFYTSSDDDDEKLKKIKES